MKLLSPRKFAIAILMSACFPAFAMGQQEDASGDPVSSAPQGEISCSAEQDASAALLAINAEREVIALRRIEVDRRLAEINLASARLQKEMEDMQALREELIGMLERSKERAAADVSKLVGIYSNMKPKEAAEIFDRLELVFTLDLLNSMDQRKASDILSAMNPDRAQALTRLMMEQNKLPGDRRLPALLKDAY